MLNGRVALVHDYLLVMRGAERTFAAIADCWPDAPIFTLLYDPAGTDGRFEGRTVVTSYLQRLRVRQGGFRRLLPLYPRAIERLPLDGYDVVVSSTSAWAHGVRPSSGAVHVSYCHSPFRYAWHEHRAALHEPPSVLRPLVRSVLDSVRDWDVAAARRVDRYVANSSLTQRRIKEFYGRDSAVLHPPVDVGRFKPSAPEGFLLVVSELVSHKRIDVVLEGARRAGRRVTVVGEGPELGRLVASYRDVAEFAGRIPDPQLADLYARADAVLVPGVEEFGIVAVEAQASGRPVIAADGGGARETVVDGVTGAFFKPGDPDAVAGAIRDFGVDGFVPGTAVEHAQRFSTPRFMRAFTDEVERATGLRAPRRPDGETVGTDRLERLEVRN
jgi:glycosyltransferase involved in cell wall biosynthesis